MGLNFGGSSSIYSSSFLRDTMAVYEIKFLIEM